MSYPGSNLAITFKDGATVDSFGRLRAASPRIVLSAVHNFDKLPLIFDETVVAGGLGTFNAPTSSVQMTVTANGDEIIRQTKRYYFYRSGLPLEAILTFAQFSPQTGVTKEVGYHDANDGVFLESAAGVVNVVLRSSTSGSPVNTRVAQSAWNVDHFDGTGPSGITIDWSFAQILVIDLQWLGVGRVRVGFSIDGQTYYAHEFRNANSLATVYMRRASLPVRYRVLAGPGTSAGRLDQICTAILHYGEEQDEGLITAVDTPISTTGTPQTATSTVRTLLSVRLRASYIRAFLKPIAMTGMPLSNAGFRFQLVLNPTVTGGLAGWTSWGQTLEYSLTQGAVTAFVHQISATYIDAAARRRLPQEIPVTENILGVAATTAGTSDVLSMTVVADVVGPLNVAGILHLLELY